MAVADQTGVASLLHLRRVNENGATNSIRRYRQGECRRGKADKEAPGHQSARPGNNSACKGLAYCTSTGRAPSSATVLRLFVMGCLDVPTLNTKLSPLLEWNGVSTRITVLITLPLSRVNVSMSVGGVGMEAPRRPSSAPTSTFSLSRKIVENFLPSLLTSMAPTNLL